MGAQPQVVSAHQVGVRWRHARGEAVVAAMWSAADWTIVECLPFAF